MELETEQKKPIPVVFGIINVESGDHKVEHLDAFFYGYINEEDEKLAVIETDKGIRLKVNPNHIAFK